MMQFHHCRKQEMMLNIRLQYNDVTTYKERYLMVKLHFNKGGSICYKHREFLKVSSINKGIIVFIKKVHVFLDTL